MHSARGGRKKCVDVDILRLFLRLVESNRREEILRTEILKKNYIFTMSVKYSVIALCFCYIVEKNV